MNFDSRRRVIQQGVANLFPGYFALVMATGIISIATYLLGMKPVAWVLLAINIAAYGVLWLLTLLRLFWYLPRLLADLTAHGRGPGFFTVVTATCVLGSQFVILRGDLASARLLWIFGIVLWVLVMYSFFTAVTVRESKPSLETGINGAWLIATVATQSVSILGTLLASHYPIYREVVLFFTFSMYLLGFMLYLTIITLIFYRFTFLEVTTATLTAPYWINMGAVAITTLAGATLILNAHQWAFLEELTPFLKGFTLFFWATGTWWIPLLFILGVWRHLYKRFPLVYDPQYWGMVFPLGMYTASTLQLAKAADLSFLVFLPRYFVYIALLAWSLTFAALLYRLYCSLIVIPRHLP